MASDGEASCGSDPNFAVICSFLERFAKSCGITHPNISELQEMLENTQEVPQPLIELHVKLLRKARKSVSGERWERALIKFCHTYSSNQDGWEIERFGYKKARLGVKLRVLKTLLEQQFDLNAKFKAEINRLSAMELRCSPLGRDKLGQTYWCQLDEACNLRVYREDLDDETWEVVASDREGLVQLISQLSSNDPFRSGSEVVNEDSNSVGVDKPVTDTGQPKSSGSKDNDDHDNDDEEFQEIPSSDLEEDDSDYDSDSKHHKEDIKPSSDSKHQKEDIKPSTGNKCLKEDTECSSDSTHQKEDLKPICDIKHKKDVVQTDSENKHQKVDIKPSSGVKLEKENEKSDSDNKHKKEDITPSSGSKQEKDIKTETEVVSSSEEIATEQKGEVKVEEVIKSDAVEKQESVSIPTCTDFEKDEKLEKQICVTQDSQNNCVEKSSEKNSCREKVVADNNVILSNEDCKITENKKSDSSSSEDKQITDDGSLCITDDVPSNQTLAPSSNSPVSSKQESILDVPISDSSKKINKDVSSTSAKRSITPTNDVPAKRLRETDSEEKALEPEVSEAIEEPVMVISGEGSGKECNTGNPVTYGDSCDNDVEVSEAIEETVMFIYGEGSGKDCDTGNPVKEGDSNENEQGENGDKSDLSKKDNLSSKGAGKVSDENVSVTNSKSESLEESVCEKKLHEENCGASISQNSPSASTSSCTADISINLEGNKPHSKQEHTSEINLSTHNTHQSSTKSKSLSETVSESVTDGANKSTEMKQMNTPDHLNVTECNPNIDNNPKEGKLGHSISSEAGASETVENFDKLDVSSAVSLITDKGKALDKNYAYSSVSSMDLTKKCLPEDSERVSKTNLAQQLSVKSVPKLWSIDTICAAKEDAGNDKTELNVPTNNAIDTQTITKIAEETHKGSSVNNNSPPGSLPKCVSRWDTGKPESSLSGECLEEKNKVDEAVIAKHLNSYPNENVQADEKESKILPRNLETEVSGSCVSEPLTSLTGLSQVNPERKGVPENFSSLASKDTITQATESKDTEQSEFGSVKVGKTKPDSHSARDSGISQESPSENTEYSDRKDKNPNISISKQTGTVKASINSSGRECDVSQDRTVEIKGAQLTVEPLKSAGVLEDGVATTLESTESKIKSSLKSELISGKNAIDSEGSRADKSLTPATYDPLNLELPSNKSCAAQMPIQKEPGRNLGKEEFSQKSNKESDVLSSQNQSKLSTYRVDTHTSASSQNKFKAGNEIDSGVSIMHVPHKLSEDRILKESKYLPDSLDISTTVIDSNKKTDIIKTTKADSETNARDHLGNISNFSAVNSSLTIEAIPLTKNSQKNCTKNSDDEFVKPLNLEKNSLVDKVKGRLVSDSISILPTTLKSRDVHTAKAQQSLSAMGKNRRKSVESITMGIMSKLAAREHQKTAQIKSIDEVMANNISDPHKIPGKINTISSDTRVIDNKDYQPLNLDKMSEKQSSSRTNDFNKPVEYQPPSSIPKKHCNLGFPPEAIHQMGLPPLPSSMLDPLRQLTNLALLSQNPADAAFLSNSLAKRFDDIASRRDVESLGLELLKKSMDGRSIDPAMALDLQMMGKFAADRKTILESQMKIPEMHLPGLEKTFNAFPPEKLNMKDATDISNLMKATDVNKLAELSLLKNFVSEPLAVKEQAWLCGGGVPLHNKADMQGHFNLPYGANAATHLYDEKMRLLSGASNTSVREKGESKRLNEEVKHRDNRHVKRTETRRELGIENIRNKSLAYYSAVKDLSNVHRDHEPSKAYPYGIPVPSRGPVAPPPKSKDSPLENLPQDLTVSSSKHGTNLSLKSPDITLKAPELSVPQKSEAIPLVKGAPYKNITIESLNDEPMAKDYSSVNSVNIKKQGLSQKFNTIPVSQNLPTQNFEKCTVPQPFQTNVADRVPENMKPLDMKLPTTTPIQQQQPPAAAAAAVTPEVPKEKIHYGLKVKPLEKLSEVKLSEIVDIAKEKVPDSKSSLNEVVMCSKPETQKLDSSKTPPLEKLEAVTYPVIKPEAEKPFTNGIKVVPLERLSEASSVSDICGVKDNTPPSETVLPDTKTEQKLDKDESVIEPVSTKVHTQPTENKERSDDTITDPKNDTVFEEKCQTEVVITKDSLKNSSGASSPPSKSVPSEEDEKRKSSDQRPIVGKIQVRSFAKECKQKFSNAEKQATSEKREQSGAEKETNKLSLAPVTLSKCKSPEVKDSKNTTDQTDKKNTAQNSKPETTELVIQGKKSEPVLSAEDKTSEPKKTELSKNSSSGSAIKLKLRSRRKSPLTPIRSDSPEKVELSKDKSKTSKVAVNEESKITSAVSSESTTNAGRVPNKKSAHGKLTDTTKDKSQSTTTDMKCELITSDTQASLKEKNPTVEVIRLKIKSPRSINENLSFDFHETVKHDVVDNKNEETDEPVTGVRRTRGRSGRFVKNQNAESEKTSVKKHEPSDAVRKHEPSDAVTKHESSDPVRKHEPSDADADTEPEHVVSNVKRTKAARGGRRALETRTRANREAALKKQEVAEVTSSDDGYKDNLQMRLAEVSTDDSQDRSAVQARGSSRKGGSRSKAKARARGAKAARGKRSGRGKSSVSATKAAIDSPPPSSDTQSDAAKTSKRGQRKSNVLGLDVGVDIVTEESKSDAGPSSDLPMRQSRRIAQIKIKEEAERRKIEELTFLTLKEDERLYKRAKKLENKGSKSDKKKKKSRKNQSDSDEDYTTGEHADASSSKRKGKQQQPQQTPQQQQKTNKKKKRKKKSGLARFNENNPWQSSSESSSSAEEEELEQTEEEEEEEEPELVFKSDHEFSPESDLEEGAAEDLPLRRARTARKETETEELEDKHACQKCGKSDHPEWILLCDKCDSGWHGSCLRPALMVIPEGDWFCPPCEHATLLGNLQESLKDLDSKLKRRENEELRRKRLAYVGISLDNVLPNKSEKEDPEASVPGSRRSSSSSSSSDSSSDESEPVYQLRQRRQTVLSYRYNDYDDLIYSAIQDEMEAVKGAGNQGRGKDIATIVNAEKEEQKEKLEADDKKIEDDETKKKKKEENGEEGGDSDDEEEEDEPEGYIPPVRRYPLPKKKHRRLNSLDISSEDDADSDEDFKGSSSEEEEEEEDDADDSEDSDARGRRGRSRKRHAEPVRRSSRARVTRFDKEFINDDSDESDVPKRKRSRRMWQDSESEESDWGKKRRKKSSGSSSKTRSKKKKRRIFEDSDLESYRKKKPKKPRIKFGGLDEDEVLSRRTRGKKINYEEVAGSDTEEEVIKRSRKLVESEDEFVINEDDGEEEEEQDPVIEQDDSSESEKDDEKDKMDEQDDESKGSPASDTNKTNVIKKKKQVIRDDTDDSDGTGGSDDEMQQLEEEMERLVEDDKNHVESSLENSGATESEVCPDNPSERLKDSLKLVEILEDSTTEAPSTETPEDVTPETLPGAEVSTPVQETKRKYVRKKPLPEKAEKSKPVCKDQNDAEMVSGTISEQQQPIPAPEDKQSFSQLSDEGSPPPPPGAGVQALRNMLEVPPLRGMMGMQQSFKNYMEPQQGVTPPSPQAPAIGHLPSSVPAQIQKNQPEQQQQPQLLQQPPQLPPPPQQKPQPPQQQPQHQHPHLQLSVKHQSQLQQPPPQTQPPQQQLQPTPPKQPPQQQQQVQPPQPHQQKSHQQIQQPPQPLQSQQPHSQIPQKQSPPPPPQQQQQQQPQPPQQKQQQPPLQQQQLQNRQQVPPLPLLQQTQPPQQQLQQQPVIHQGQPPPMQRLEAMHVKNMHNPPNVVGMQMDRAIDPPPVPSEQHIIRMSGEVQSPPKRKGRGRGKATLAAAAAAEAGMAVGDQTRYPPQSQQQQPQQQQQTPQQQQQQQPPPPQQQQQQPPHQQQQSPQPQHYAPHPSPVNSNAPGSVISRMLQTQTVSQHSPQSFTAAAAAMGHKYFGSNPDQRYAPVSPGKPGRIPSPYRQTAGPPSTSSPAMMQQHYTSRPGLIRPPPTNTAPISQPMRSRVPATQPASLYHGSHHPLDPSPSGGGPISVAPGPNVVQRPADGSQQPAPAMAVPVATGSPLGGKPTAGAVPVSLSTPSPQPPPPYNRPRFPPDIPQAAPGAPPAPRHSFSPAAHMHAQPSPPPPPAPQHQQPPHHSLQQGRVPSNYPPYHAPPPPPPPSYHYGNYPPHPTVTVGEEGLQHSPYQPASYTDQYVNPAVESPHIQQLPDHSSSESRPYEEDSGGEFGGLVSYFSSQREDDLDA